MSTKETPVVKKASVATGKAKEPVIGKVTSSNDQMLLELKKIGIPTVATGGDLATWKADLVTISSIQVSKEPKDNTKWIIIEGEGASKIPALQYRVLVFCAMTVISSVRTDRGYAYITFVNNNEKVISKYFNGYTIRIRNAHAALPVVQVSVPEILELAKVLAPIAGRSLELEKPVRETRSISTKVTAEEVDLVL